MNEFQNGYAAARNYYSTKEARVEALLEAWADPMQDRARDAIRIAWPALNEAMNQLKDWEESH